MHVFDLVHELQRLRAKGALVPLDAAERAQLETLTGLVAGACDEDDEPSLIRLLRPLPCHLALPLRGFVDAELRTIGAEGLILGTDEALTPGDRVLVHVDAFGAHYTFPCRVDLHTALGVVLSFDGVPRRERDSAA